MGWLKKVANATVSAATVGIYNPQTGFAKTPGDIVENAIGGAVTAATGGLVDGLPAGSAPTAPAGSSMQDQYLAFMMQQFNAQLPAYNKSTQLAQEFQQQQIDASKTAIKTAEEDRTRYLSNFVPIENKAAAEALTAGGEQDQQKQAMLAKGDVSTALANQRAATNRQMASMGVNPNSARFAATRNANDITLAAAEGSAMTRARQAASALGWSKKMDAANLGRGVASNQTTALNAATNAGAYGNSSASTALNSQNASTSGVAGAYNTIIGAQTSAANAQLQADVASSAGWGQLLGTGIGAGAAVY